MQACGRDTGIQHASNPSPGAKPGSCLGLASHDETAGKSGRVKKQNLLSALAEFFFDGSRRHIPSLAVLAVFCVFAGNAQAGRKHLESWYANALAAELGARTEVRMRNGTRCDVLAVHHAIEVEFAGKWAEAVGQALNYSSQTGRTGAIALVLESPADERFLTRLREVISWHQLPIVVVVLRPFGKGSLELQGLDELQRGARE